VRFWRPRGFFCFFLGLPRDSQARPARAAAPFHHGRRPRRRRGARARGPARARAGPGPGAAAAAAPSAKVRERMLCAAPGSGHRLCLLGRRARRPPGGADGATAAFDVLGATGNVYTVNFSRHPGCSCPDWAKGNVCKHRLFVALRVLKLAAGEPRAWQRALLPAKAAAALAGSCERGAVGGAARARRCGRRMRGLLRATWRGGGPHRALRDVWQQRSRALGRLGRSGDLPVLPRAQAGRRRRRRRGGLYKPCGRLCCALRGRHLARGPLQRTRYLDPVLLRRNFAP
jgi:hypothetical protein